MLNREKFLSDISRSWIIRGIHSSRNLLFGTITEGKVVRIIEKGLIAELPEGVDGFVPANQLSTSKLKNLANHFPVDDTIPIKVIEFDKSNKKIVLSTIAALKDKSDNEILDYLNKHNLRRYL